MPAPGAARALVWPHGRRSGRRSGLRSGPEPTLDPVGVVLLEGARFKGGLEPGSPQPLPAAHVLLEAAIHASDVSASSTSTTPSGSGPSTFPSDSLRPRS